MFLQYLEACAKRNACHALKFSRDYFDFLAPRSTRLNPTRSLSRLSPSHTSALQFLPTTPSCSSCPCRRRPFCHAPAHASLPSAPLPPSPGHRCLRPAPVGGVVLRHAARLPGPRAAGPGRPVCGAGRRPGRGAGPAGAARPRGARRSGGHALGRRLPAGRPAGGQEGGAAGHVPHARTLLGR